MALHANTSIHHLVAAGGLGHLQNDAQPKIVAAKSRRLPASHEQPRAIRSGQHAAGSTLREAGQPLNLGAPTMLSWLAGSRC